MSPLPWAFAGRSPQPAMEAGGAANVQIASSPLLPANSKVGEEHRTSLCEVVRTPHIMKVQLPSTWPQPASSTSVEIHGSLIGEPPANVQGPRKDLRKVLIPPCKPP
ncbi:unnamed protein product [Arctogadus glacialis]